MVGMLGREKRRAGDVVRSFLEIDLVRVWLIS